MQQDSAPALLQAARTIVIKVGSALLVDEHGALRSSWLESLARDIADLQSAGKSVAVVSSGAVALGATTLGIPRATMQLRHKQAAAAIGQIELAQRWRDALDSVAVGCAQVLLSPQDTEHRRRHLNARATLKTLADQQLVAIINENDTVATDELRYGDNDKLAARVAQMIGADVLVLLSDVDGLYDADPTRVAGAMRISHVARINDDIMGLAGDKASEQGTGGMTSKLKAARIATLAGASVVIASGKPAAPIQALRDGAPHTRFDAGTTVINARRKWIMASLKPSAEVHIDAGACNALSTGKSLLPVGVVRLRGSFDRGDCISIHGPNGEIAIGLASLSSDDANAAMSIARTGERTEALVHRDNLVVNEA
ncbi:MAG: glutamate 5-kinase [Pseudomonadota bacterium]